MDAMGIHAKEGGLEDSLQTLKLLIVNGDHLPISQHIELFSKEGEDAAVGSSLSKFYFSLLSHTIFHSAVAVKL